MTALHDAVATMPEQRSPLPEGDAPAEAGQPPAAPEHAAPEHAGLRRAIGRWALPATAGALMLVMAGTTAAALSRAGDRADRLATTRGELTATKAALTDTKAELESTRSDLAAERLSLAQVRSDLTSSRADASDLRSCVDSMMTFLAAAAEGDVAAATTALRMSNCDDVVDSGAGKGSNA